MKKLPAGDLTAKAFDLSKTIAYQKGAVVSKTLIGKKTGTITLFSFDKGQGLSEHTAPFDAFVFICDGEAEITVAGKKHIASKGEFIVMPAHAPHSLKAARRFKMMLVMVRSQ
jgi:quercetin dioxygenase-like cupin family protein